MTQAARGDHRPAPIGRLGHAEEVAEQVAWISSGKASFVNGAHYPVDGGLLA